MSRPDLFNLSSCSVRTVVLSPLTRPLASQIVDIFCFYPLLVCRSYRGRKTTDRSINMQSSHPVNAVPHGADKPIIERRTFSESSTPIFLIPQFCIPMNGRSHIIRDIPDKLLQRIPCTSIDYTSEAHHTDYYRAQNAQTISQYQFYTA